MMIYLAFNNFKYKNTTKLIGIMCYIEKQNLISRFFTWRPHKGDSELSGTIKQMNILITFELTAELTENEDENTDNFVDLKISSLLQTEYHKP